MIDEHHDHLKLFIGSVLAGISAITLSQWVLITTLIYTVMQAGLLIPRYIAIFKNRKNRRPVNDR